MINPQQPNGYVTWDENIVTHKNTNSLPRLCFHSLTETFILNQTKESRLKFRYFMSALTIFQLGIRHIIPNSENEKKKTESSQMYLFEHSGLDFFYISNKVLSKQRLL